MSKKSFFSCITGIILAFFLIPCALARTPVSVTEPMWVKITRIPDSEITVYYDIRSILSDHDIIGGILLYVPDIPAFVDTEPGHKALAKSKVASMVIDCTKNIFGVVSTFYYDVEQPRNKDKPIRIERNDHPEIKSLKDGSFLHQLFCKKITT